jgi:hypothetical protein
MPSVSWGSLIAGLVLGILLTHLVKSKVGSSG